MTVGKNPLQGSFIQPRTAMAKLYRYLVSVVLIFVSVSVTQVSTEKVAQATELSCAEGGVCVLGDIGPGGGKVFYVAPTTFASPGSDSYPGSDCDDACKYLEVAPGSAQRTLRWASTSNQSRSVADNATNTAIGTGMANTIKIANQSGNTSTDSAAVYAYEYQGGGKEDWHLPSFEEIRQLFTNQSRVESGLKDFWWSSSESSSTNARRKHLLRTNGGEGTASKSGANHMRPVRAFASLPTLTVTYNSQEGSSATTGSTTSGGVIASAPVAPTRTGYVSTGWFRRQLDMRQMIRHRAEITYLKVSNRPIKNHLDASALTAARAHLKSARQLVVAAWLRTARDMAAKMLSVLLIAQRPMDCHLYQFDLAQLPLAQRRAHQAPANWLTSRIRAAQIHQLFL